MTDGSGAKRAIPQRYNSVSYTFILDFYELSNYRKSSGAKAVRDWLEITALSGATLKLSRSQTIDI